MSYEKSAFLELLELEWWIKALPAAVDKLIDKGLDGDDLSSFIKEIDRTTAMIERRRDELDRQRERELEGWSGTPSR
jgi:hypothetical protein